MEGRSRFQTADAIVLIRVPAAHLAQPDTFLTLHTGLQQITTAQVHGIRLLFTSAFDELVNPGCGAMLAVMVAGI